MAVAESCEDATAFSDYVIASVIRSIADDRVQAFESVSRLRRTGCISLSGEAVERNFLFLDQRSTTYDRRLASRTGVELKRCPVKRIVEGAAM